MHRFPLFERFEALERKIGRLELTEIPTPVLRLNGLEKLFKRHNPIWIKRDDLSSRVYGGNKPRKLEFLLKQAKDKNYKVVITSGGIGSNHCLATAIYSSRLGFKSVSYLFPQPINDYVKKTNNYIKRYSELRTCSNPISAYVKSFIISNVKSDNYYIPPGGSSALGNLGYVNAMLEIDAQIKDGILPAPDIVIVPFGSGGTLAGIEAGRRLLGLNISIIGVAVINRIVANKLMAEILIRKTLHFIEKTEGKNLSFSPTGFFLENNYIGRGYGWETDKCIQAIKTIYDTDGIILEPTYTGKAMAYLIDLIKNDKGSKILFWNTYNSRELNTIS